MALVDRRRSVVLAVNLPGGGGGVGWVTSGRRRRRGRCRRGLGCMFSCWVGVSTLVSVLPAVEARQVLSWIARELQPAMAGLLLNKVRFNQWEAPPKGRVHDIASVYI